MLYNSKDPPQGWIILPSSFMRGKMPYDGGDIPLNLRSKWYPMIFHQEEIAEAIVTSGPFAPRDQTPTSWDISLGYQFNFKLGGNLLNPKQVGDPCKQPKHEIPEPSPGNFIRDVQITDPRKVGDSFQFHPWNLRRGFLSSSSIKRILEDSETDEEPQFPPTDTGGDPPVAGRPLEELCSSHLRWLLQQQETSPPPSKRSRQEEEEEEDPAQGLQLQLQEQLQRQRKLQQHLKLGIRALVKDMLKTQRGMAVDPYLR